MKWNRCQHNRKDIVKFVNMCNAGGWHWCWLIGKPIEWNKENGTKYIWSVNKISFFWFDRFCELEFLVKRMICILGRVFVQCFNSKDFMFIEHLEASHVGMSFSFECLHRIELETQEIMKILQNSQRLNNIH